MSSPIITPVSDPNLSGIVRLEDVLQQMADHKGCGTTSGDSGKTSYGNSAGSANEGELICGLFTRCGGAAPFAPCGLRGWVF